ncbi:MAG: hypothetical protein KGL02_08175 [Acidobacteriota bacterium]|nr:hypothetical protein [Acidobacteriota bacterium]MDE3168968.1 hypothetical protein [Acidobacteriota bacterium]
MKFAGTSQNRRSQTATRSFRRAAILPLAGSLVFFLAAIAPAIRAARQGNSRTRSDVRAYVGTWKARFHKKVFAILVLRENHGALEGTLNNFEIAADKQGNLTDGTHIDLGVAPLISPRLKDGALIFTVAQKDAYAQTTDWSFVVKNSREGELTEILDNQIELPANTIIKPISMFREGVDRK